MAHPPERAGPSAAADVVRPPAASRPEPEPEKAAATASMATVVVSQTRQEEELGVAAAGVKGGHEKEGPLAHQNGQNGQLADAEVVVAEAAAKLQLRMAVPEPVMERFAPVKDVKTMLQTGLFEGQRIVYKNKKEKIDLLHGVIKGTAYFCLCGGYCDQTGKELSAKSFEQHAKAESHNANDHIYPQLSTMSLFEISKRLKEAKDASMLQKIVNRILQPNDLPQSPKVTTANDVCEDYSVIIKRLHMLEHKMEQFEKKVDQINQMQIQINTIEQNVEFLVNQTVRSRKLFEEVSQVFGKFKDI